MRFLPHEGVRTTSVRGPGQRRSGRAGVPQKQDGPYSDGESLYGPDRNWL